MIDGCMVSTHIENLMIDHNYRWPLNGEILERVTLLNHMLFLMQTHSFKSKSKYLAWIRNFAKIRQKSLMPVLFVFF